MSQSHGNCREIKVMMSSNRQNQGSFVSAVTLLTLIVRFPRASQCHDQLAGAKTLEDFYLPSKGQVSQDSWAYSLHRLRLRHSFKGGIAFLIKFDQCFKSVPCSACASERSSFEPLELSQTPKRIQKLDPLET